VLESAMGEDARRHAEAVLTLSVLVLLLTSNPALVRVRARG
jgi:hypothetical protein